MRALQRQWCFHANPRSAAYKARRDTLYSSHCRRQSVVSQTLVDPGHNRVANAAAGLTSIRTSVALLPSDARWHPATIMSATAAAGSNGSGPGEISERVASLRDQMRQAAGGAGVDAYIIPSEDPHMSEYAPANEERRHFISQFTGSAGTAVVTQEHAALWTDGRYFLQAEQQLGPGWTLMREGTPGCPSIHAWLGKTLPEGARIGIDPFLHTMDAAKTLAANLEGSGQVLVPLLEGNLVDKVWGADRPPQPQAPLRVHALEWAGESVSDKLRAIRAELDEQKAGAVLVTALDEVAWLLNLRGGDVSYNPVFVSYALVTPDAATLYTSSDKVTKEAAAHLAEAGVKVQGYGEVLHDVRQLAAVGQRLWLDPSKVSHAISQAAQEAAAQGKTPRKRTRRSGEAAPTNGKAAGALVLEARSPVTLRKAVKNGAELAGMREAHLRDGVALAEFLSWLEAEIGGGGTVTEVEVDEKLTARRAAQEGFIEPSFPTIAGAGGHGAIIHYRASAETAATVDSNTLLLIDSGGQYACGTTDVTRTMHFGMPTAHQKAAFTRVLQGHIALDSAVFPEGTPGLALDTLARAPLWRLGLNYRHGTGHGVGAALNVHEGPHSISTRYYITEPLQAGMIVSNEPGYYEDGAFGIRIENLLIIKEADTEFRFGGQSFMSFERLTMCPLQRKMIDLEVLSKDEVAWVDKYHAEVYNKLSPRVQGPALEWLRRNTAPLEVPAAMALA